MPTPQVVAGSFNPGCAACFICSTCGAFLPFWAIGVSLAFTL